MTYSVADLSMRQTASPSEERLVQLFFGLYKTARIVDSSNATFIKQAKAFHDQLQRAFDQTTHATIKVVADRYFYNDHLARIDEQASGAASIATEWRQVGIGGTQFADRVTTDQIAQFFAFTADLKSAGGTLEEIMTRLKSLRIENIELLAAAQERDLPRPIISEEMRQQFRQAARSRFFKALSNAEEVIVGAAQNKEVNISKTKRVVHGLIDHIMRDEQSLLELTAIKDYDDYTYAHSTNVCVYSLTMGVRFGLDRPRLSQLGFAALFHDIGKVKLPKDLINKPDAYDEDDWRQMQMHPILGAKTILRNLRFDTYTARAARVAFEHHINSDFTGYPVLKSTKIRPTLFSRIVAIADTFDALTSDRIYLRKALSPDEVIRKMHYQMSAKFDPFLLKIFTNIIGMYPAGSLVLLSTDEIAVIITNNEWNPSRPYVKIVGNRDGLLAIPEWRDLSQADYADQTILRLIDPERYGLKVADFILAD
ncbi:MAG: HD domain-containing phosphohydrolase [Candidatus Zixiibacteriota bacterium]